MAANVWAVDWLAPLASSVYTFELLMVRPAKLAVPVTPKPASALAPVPPTFRRKKLLLLEATVIVPLLWVADRPALLSSGSTAMPALSALTRSAAVRELP